MIATKGRRDFTEGPLFWRITGFALPIMLTGLLQIAYNMADNIVVGKFSGDPNALAAVGCTGSLTTLIINLLLGLSAGTGVVVAQLYGAKDDRGVSRAVHTALIMALAGGLMFMSVGLIVSRPALTLMGTKPEIIDLSVLYVRIICIGIPANAIYNFGASILRATGDSKSPLIILSSTGLVNVMLNLVFVIALNMSVSGVAIATITAQYISAISVVTVLANKKGAPFRFSFSKLCFDKKLFGNITRFGVPSGLTGAMFSFTNVFIASAVNSFPTTTVTANTIASNVDALTYTAMNSFYQAAITFTAQNYGAFKLDRIKKSIAYCLIQVASIGSIVSGLELIFMERIIGLYLDKSDPSYMTVVDTAKGLITMLLIAYILCGLMDTVCGALRGMGYALPPMLVSIGCICGIRLFWIFVIFPLERMHSLVGLYTVYPISWTAALIGMSTIACFALKRVKRLCEEKEKRENAEREEEPVSVQ